MKNSRVHETKPSLTGIIRKQLARVKTHHIRKNVFAHLIENSLICASGSQKRLRKSKASFVALVARLQETKLIITTCTSSVFVFVKTLHFFFPPPSLSALLRE